MMHTKLAAILFLVACVVCPVKTFQFVLFFNVVEIIELIKKKLRSGCMERKCSKRETKEG
jgi:hypothetical protein